MGPTECGPPLSDVEQESIAVGRSNGQKCGVPNKNNVVFSLPSKLMKLYTKRGYWTDQKSLCTTCHGLVRLGHVRRVRRSLRTRTVLLYKGRGLRFLFPLIGKIGHSRSQRRSSVFSQKRRHSSECTSTDLSSHFPFDF